MTQEQLRSDVATLRAQLDFGAKMCVDDRRALERILAVVEPLAALNVLQMAHLRRRVFAVVERRERAARTLREFAERFRSLGDPDRALEQDALASEESTEGEAWSALLRALGSDHREG